MGHKSKVHFLTAYLEYLYDQGIKSEYYYIGDASRFLRYLLARCGPEEIEGFLHSASSPAYRKRLLKTLRRFYAFAECHLDVPQRPLEEVDRKPGGPSTSIDKG